MTPKEKAKELADDFGWDEDQAAGTYAIELAIRAAYEDAAMIAEGGAELAGADGYQIAAAIRERLKT